MKPAGRIDFAFDTGLVVCLRDHVEDGELQVSFEESLSLQLVAGGVHSLVFLASQIQKEHSIADLLNFLIAFLMSLLLKPNFLKHHKTHLEQHPLAVRYDLFSVLFFLLGLSLLILSLTLLGLGSKSTSLNPGRCVHRPRQYDTIC